MSILDASYLDNGAVAVNVGTMFGYVLVELTDHGVQVTVIDGQGDVVAENEYTLAQGVAHD
jgi:hypothetical protein